MGAVVQRSPQTKAERDPCLAHVAASGLLPSGRSRVRVRTHQPPVPGESQRSKWWSLCIVS